jgi:hypothetical protein
MPLQHLSFFREKMFLPFSTHAAWLDPVLNVVPPACTYCRDTTSLAASQSSGSARRSLVKRPFAARARANWLMMYTSSNWGPRGSEVVTMGAMSIIAVASLRSTRVDAGLHGLHTEEVTVIATIRDNRVMSPHTFYDFDRLSGIWAGTYLLLKV